jgi:CheY-like chemotaxis protein
MKPILLVEDDETDVIVFKRTMVNAELANEVVWVPSGIAAVEKLTGEQKYSAVFTDLMLQEMDGLQLISWVKEKYPNLLIVAISHRDEMDIINRAYQAGAAFYIAKPVREVDLINLTKHYHIIIDSLATDPLRNQPKLPGFEYNE